MKKALTIIVILTFVLTNTYSQTKEKVKPIPTEKPTPDSVVSGFTLVITNEEYVNIKNILTFLLSTNLSVGSFVSFQEAFSRAKPIVVVNPNKQK